MRDLATLVVLTACVVTPLGCDDSGETLKPDNVTSTSTNSSSTTGTAGRTTTSSAGGAGGSSSSGTAGAGGAGASGGGSAEVTGFVSGTRLRARYWDGTDGSRQFFGWHDSQLGVDCHHSLASDGKYRCLPVGGTVFYHADVSCMVPVYHHSTQCPAPLPSYVKRAVDALCSTGGHSAHPLGAQTTPSAVYYRSGSNCVNAGAVPAGYDFYLLGTEITPSQFVEAAELVE